MGRKDWYSVHLPKLLIKRLGDLILKTNDRDHLVLTFNDESQY